MRLGSIGVCVSSFCLDQRGHPWFDHQFADVEAPDFQRFDGNRPQPAAARHE